jgi:hypothetical protein
MISGSKCRHLNHAGRGLIMEYTAAYQNRSLRFCNTAKQSEWRNIEGFDIHNKNRREQYRRYRMNDADFRPLTFAHMIEEYIRHPEAKSLGPDGKPCTAETRGLLQRAHITAGRIRYIDKETSSMWAQGDDLSVVTDNDETGFRVIEYGKGRMVVVPDSVKREMRAMACGN